MRLLCTLALAAVIAACGSPAPDTKKAPAPDPAATDLKAIKAAGELWFDAFRTGDPGSVAAFYSQEAVLMPPESPYVVGRRAIKERFADELLVLKSAGITLELDETDLGVSGTVAWRTGTFLGTGPDGKSLGSGKFLQVWQKQPDGLWHITHGMYNYDAPREVLLRR